MRNKIIKPFSLLMGTMLTIALLPGCKKAGEFGDQYITDPNPNANSVGSTSQLITNALYRSAGRGSGGAVNGDMLTLGDKEAAEYVQYISEAIYPGTSLYASTYGEWSSYYTGPLMDLATIINYNTDATLREQASKHGSNNNQLATARIWKAYLFSIVTDRWGDVPYFDANKIGIINPKYDRQQDIYNDLFKELKEAADQFDGGIAFKGDILFNGDASKWKKFANSLRMVLALRLSKVDPATGKAQYMSAISHPAGYITTNTENASFAYQNNRDFRNPWHNNHTESNAFGMSEFFVNLLKNNNDPRLPVMADAASPGVYRGIPYGLDAGNLATWTSANVYSKLGAAYRQQNTPGYFITASQMLLTRAEAALLGWVTGTNAKNDYEDAIRFDMQRLGITNTTTINTYIASAPIAINVVNVADALQKVRMQKYFALFPNGFEAFSEWRRTNVPPLVPAQYALNPSKQIPRRWGYPTSEATLNAANYQAALSVLGGDNSIDRRVWWDKP